MFFKQDFYLINRDYRKEKKLQLEENKENNLYQKYSIRLSQLSHFSHHIFEGLLADNLIMGRFKFPSKSFNNNVILKILKFINFKLLNLINEFY